MDEERRLFDKKLAEAAELRIRKDHNLNDFTTQSLTFRKNGSVKGQFVNDDKKVVTVEESEDAVYRYYYDELVEQGEIEPERVPVVDFIRLYKGGIPVHMMADALE